MGENFFSIQCKPRVELGSKSNDKCITISRKLHIKNSKEIFENTASMLAYKTYHIFNIVI